MLAILDKIIYIHYIDERLNSLLVLVVTSHIERFKGIKKGYEKFFTALLNTA